MEGSCKILFKFMTYVNCYAIKLLRYAIIYSVVVILTVFDTVRGHGLTLFLSLTSSDNFFRLLMWNLFISIELTVKYALSLSDRA